MKTWLPYMCLAVAALTALVALGFLVPWAVRVLPALWRRWLRRKVLKELEAEHKLRMDRAVAEAKREAELRLIETLLIPLDNLNHAVQAARRSSTEGVGSLRAHADGLQYVQESFFSMLRLAGVDSFEPTGQTFDPHLHHAICVVEDESLAAGSVAETLNRGYVTGVGASRRLLRPALVTVVAAAEPELLTGDLGGEGERDDG